MYRISWKSKTGVTGSGDYCLTIHEANKTVERLNEKLLNEVFHWVEQQLDPERPPALNLKGHSCSYGDLTFVATASSPSPKASPVSTR
jgi:hypothetical protein